MATKKIKSGGNKVIVDLQRIMRLECPHCGSQNLIFYFDLDNFNSSTFSCNNCYSGGKHSELKEKEKIFSKMDETVLRAQLTGTEERAKYYKNECEAARKDISDLVQENTYMRKIIKTLLDKEK